MGNWWSKHEERIRAAEENVRQAQTDAQEANKTAQELNKRTATMMGEMQAREEEFNAQSQQIKESQEAIKQLEATSKNAAEKADRALQKVEEAEKAAREAKEEAEREASSRIEVERCWKAGIQPEIFLTDEEIQEMKKRMQYNDSLFHFAVAGISGGGKSSIINAFRGLKNKSPGAAPSGITETTLEITRYPSADPELPFVWYDVPGAGTQTVSGWQHFISQGLYVFDSIIVVFDGRFTETDISILNNCKRFSIPTFIVRSKADQHIRNMIEMDDDSDEDDERDKELLYRAARKKFIDETRKTVQCNLKKAELPDQPVYIVSADALRNVVKNKKSMKIIDELELLRDLYVCVHKAWGLEVRDPSLKDFTVWVQSFQSSSRSSPSQVDMEVSKEWESVGFE